MSKFLQAAATARWCNEMRLAGNLLSFCALYDSAQKESRFPTGRISLHCNGVDECGQIISPVLCLQWL